MQRRSVPRTDPRYNQIRAKNNDSVKKSREKSRRERDDTVSAIQQLENENRELAERVQLLKNEYQQLHELFQQHTGIAFSPLAKSESTSTTTEAAPPVEQRASTSTLTIDIDKDTTRAVSSNALNANNLDGSIVLINGVQYRIVSIDQTAARSSNNDDVHGR
jgi:predicted nuclease with TOPRIM domain